MIECARVRELLPWHLNGTLEGDEAAAVSGHLERCAACRDELEATRAAASVFAAHPSAASLAAWAAGEVDDASEAVGTHLATCVSCREEVALAQAGLAALEDPAPASARQRPGWLAGVAAVLVMAALAGIAWVVMHRGVEASRTRVAALARRVDNLEGEAHRLQDRIAAAAQAAARTRGELAAARQRLAEQAGARLDVRVLELLPGVLTLRGPAAAELPSVPADRLLSLVLVREDARPFTSYRLTARDRAGRQQWEVTGLTPQPDGDIALVVPAEQLGEGELRLVLEGASKDGRWEKVGEYRMEVTPVGLG